MVRRRFSRHPRGASSIRALRETEVFLAEALRHPERHARIPVVRVGFGAFSSGLAAEFWAPILNGDGQ